MDEKIQEEAGVVNDEAAERDDAFALGLSHELRGDLEAAEAAYRRADQLGDARAAFTLAVLLERHRDDDGEAAYGRALERKGSLSASDHAAFLDAIVAAYQRSEQRGEPRASFRLGKMLELTGDLEGAEAAYRRGDERGEFGLAFYLGVVRERRGDLHGAEEAFRRGDEAGITEAASNLGLLLHRRGDLDGAEAAFRRAEERGLAKAAANLGLLLEHDRGDLAGAEAAYRRGDEGRSGKAAANLALLLDKRGDVAGAQAAWRRAIDWGDDADVGAIGVVLEQRGDLSGAETAYRRADEQGDAEAAFNLGQLLLGRGDVAGARAAWRRAVDHDPGHAAAERADGMLLATMFDGATIPENVARCLDGPYYHSHWKDLQWVVLTVTGFVVFFGGLFVSEMQVLGGDDGVSPALLVALVALAGAFTGISMASRHSGLKRFDDYG